MRYRKNVFVLVIFLLLLVFPESIINAAPQTEEEFYDYVRSLGYKVTTDNGKTANFGVYKEYNSIVWGDSHGRLEYSSLCGRDSEWEYLGYQENGISDVGNSCFPNDIDSGVHPSCWNFVKVVGAVQSWDGLSKEQIDFLLNTPLMGNGASFEDNFTIIDIGGIEYAKVESPPTWGSQGVIYTENTGVKLGCTY